MSEEKTNEVKKIEEVLILKQDDVRGKNWELALRLMLREMKALNDRRIDLIFDRYKVAEMGGVVDNSPRTTLEFPDNVSRIQWFINSNGEAYVKYIEGKK